MWNTGKWKFLFILLVDVLKLTETCFSLLGVSLPKVDLKVGMTNQTLISNFQLLLITSTLKYFFSGLTNSVKFGTKSHLRSQSHVVLTKQMTIGELLPGRGSTWCFLFETEKIAIEGDGRGDDRKLFVGMLSKAQVDQYFSW